MSSTSHGESSPAVPVLFLIFNRPDLTARTFQRIREAQPARLYVAADGPRDLREGEEDACQLARKTTEDIDWPCEVQRLYRADNLGCKMAVSSAISWFFEHEERGIILEDDCLPDLSFFVFCAEMLEHYADDPRVMTISGSNFQNGKKRGSGSYYFSRYPHVWGWATWRRTWQQYDPDLKQWPISEREVHGWIHGESAWRYFSRSFDGVKAARIDTWDYQLSYCQFIKRALTVIPAHNLVENIGYDERATHTLRKGDNPTEDNIILPLARPLVHVPPTGPHEEADRHTEQQLYSSPGKLLRAMRRLKRSMRRYCRISFSGRN